MIRNYHIKYHEDIEASSIRSEVQKKIEKLLRKAKEAKVYFDVIEYKPNLFMVAVPNESKHCLSDIHIERVPHMINGLWLMGEKLRKWRLAQEMTTYTPMARDKMILRKRNSLFWYKQKKKPSHKNYFNSSENYKVKEVARILSKSYQDAYDLVVEHYEELVLGKICGSLILEGRALNRLCKKDTKTTDE